MSKVMQQGGIGRDHEGGMVLTGKRDTLGRL